MVKVVFCVSLILISPSLLFAQVDADDASKSVYTVALDSAIARLNHAQLAVYSGRAFYPYFLKEWNKYGPLSLTAPGSRPDEHPFFLKGEFKDEMIVLKGIKYSPVSLSYDICKSEVVVLNPQSLPIVLPEGKVQKFTYAGHSFEWFSGIHALKDDFYDVLFTDETTILCAKRRKNQTELWRTISEYYIILNDQAYAVKGFTSGSAGGVKQSVFKILKEKEELVRAFIRESNLKFGKSKRESSLVKVITYYAGLKDK